MKHAKSGPFVNPQGRVVRFDAEAQSRDTIFASQSDQLIEERGSDAAATKRPPNGDPDFWCFCVYEAKAVRLLCETPVPGRPDWLAHGGFRDESLISRATPPVDVDGDFGPG